MDENENTIVVEYQTPTVKEQLVAAGIAVGVTLVATVALTGVAVAYNAVAEKVEARRRRIADKKALLNEE